MSFPGRPAMVPGIPLPPTMGMAPYMPPMIPSVMAMPPMMPVRPFRPTRHRQREKYFSEPPKRGPPEGGPTITVFIGNIVEHAPDLMIKHILATCGQVVNWKRIQGFGFCEFGSPESALRAIRILHDLPIGTKKLVVKVDANTTVKLTEYKKVQRKKQGKRETNSEIELEDYIDEQVRSSDRRATNTIFQIIEEFQEEMENALLEKKEEMQFNKEIIQNLPDPNRAQKSQEILSKLSRDADKSNIDVEDGKRELITREIGKFREIMKKQEAQREEERQRRQQERQETREKKTEEVNVKSEPRSPSRSRSISAARSFRSQRSPSLSKASSPEARHRSRSRRARSHSRSRERERDLDRVRERDRDREQSKPRVSKRDMDRAAARELEEEEEAKERKKLEKKTREKEVAYQERVRMWESRERRKRKEYEKEKEKKNAKEEEMAREAKKLKEFLEDYDDERDDAKYYKGRELQKRMAEREKEKELDDKDRLREKEEIDELRNKVLESDHSDPTAIYEQLLQEHENQYKPRILIDVNAEQMTRIRERERDRQERERIREAVRAVNEERLRVEAEAVSGDRSNKSSPSDEDDDRGADFGATSNHNSPPSDEDVQKKASPIQLPGKKKKLDVKDVFNADEDEDVSQGPKRRKLVPLDYDEKEKVPKDKEHKKKDHHKKDDKKDENSKTTEEKRKHIKSLIDKIPTDKSALFEYTIDWTMVDNTLMEKRIRPWINKKIIEYIGEPEPTLVDFICSKVLAGSQPQGILDDVQMVLDEEAEVFVVKMWRLLIYEIEAKKMGFVK